MDLKDAFLINRPVRPSPQDISSQRKPGELFLESDSGDDITIREGVFVTPQSITSFPGASIGVTALWKVIGVFSPSMGSDHRVAFGCAFIVGLAIFGVSISESWSKDNVSLRIRSMIIALINISMLFLTAVGADTALDGNVQGN